jgi:hypothetical protein
MNERSAMTTYDRVVAATHVYLGPAADRFIARQIENHLHKAPQELSQSDLLNLLDWIRAVVSLISDDGEVIEEYLAELRKLATNMPDGESAIGRSNV